jgi:hypothetical protein
MKYAGGAVLGGVIVAQAIPDPSDAFEEFPELPKYASADQVQDGVDRLRALTSRVSARLAAIDGCGRRRSRVEVLDTNALLALASSTTP